MSLFCGLRSWHSPSDGVCPPADLVRAAKNQGATRLVCLEKWSPAGWLEYSVACKAAKIEFIPGIELLARISTKSRPVPIAAIIGDDSAFRALNGLLSAAVCDEQGRPVVDFITPPSPLLPPSLLLAAAPGESLHAAGGTDAIGDMIAVLKGTGATVAVKADGTPAGNHASVTLAVRHSLPVFPAPVQTLPLAEDAMRARNLLVVQSGENHLAQYPDGAGLSVKPVDKFFEKSPDIQKLSAGLLDSLRGVDIEALLSTKGESRVSFRGKAEEQSLASLSGYCHAALDKFLRERGGANASAYRDRLDDELEKIKKIGCAGFFLSMSSLRKKLLESGIPASVRGSSAGCLVLHLTGVSPLDPVAAGIPATRFLNPERSDFPDIDLDVPRDEQARARQILASITPGAVMAGEFHFHTPGEALRAACTQALREARHRRHRKATLSPATLPPLPTVAALGKEVLGVLGISGGEYSWREVRGSARYAALAGTRVQPDYLSPAARMAWTKEQTDAWSARFAVEEKKRLLARIAELAPLIEGTPKSPSASVAKMLAGRAPAAGEMPLMVVPAPEAWGQPGASCIISAVPAKVAGAGGAVGYDLLSLPYLGMLRSLARAVDLRRDKCEPTPENLARATCAPAPASEITPGVLAASLGRGCVEGVFQVTNNFGRKLLADFCPKFPGEIRDFLAYIRVAGDTMRAGGKLEQSGHPALRELSAATRGLLIYQEQVMAAAGKFAGWSEAEGDRLRRAIAKKDAPALKGMRQRFAADCKSFSPAEAVALFDEITNRGQYTFPAAHAAAYAELTLKSLWYKVRYPGEFVAAYSGYVKDIEKNKEQTRAALGRGVYEARLMGTSVGVATWKSPAPLASTTKSGATPSVTLGLNAMPILNGDEAAAVAQVCAAVPKRGVEETVKAVLEAKVPAAKVGLLVAGGFFDDGEETDRAKLHKVADPNGALPSARWMKLGNAQMETMALGFASTRSLPPVATDGKVIPAHELSDNLAGQEITVAGYLLPGANRAKKTGDSIQLEARLSSLLGDHPVPLTGTVVADSNLAEWMKKGVQRKPMALRVRVGGAPGNLSLTLVGGEPFVPGYTDGTVWTKEKHMETERLTAPSVPPAPKKLQFRPLKSADGGKNIFLPGKTPASGLAVT